MSFWVRDEEGMGIPNALVTLSYLDEEGVRVTTSVTATAGNTPGIAVFDETDNGRTTLDKVGMIAFAIPAIFFGLAFVFSAL